jgi:hypothetical protein
MMAARIRYTTFRPKLANRPGSTSSPTIPAAVAQHPEGVDPRRVGVPAAQLIHRIISVPPASEAMKRAASSVSYWVTAAETRLATRNTAQAHRATRRQSRRLIHHHAGSVARLIAQLRGEQIADLPGF